MDITFKDKHTTITYFNISPCQHSSEHCICDLHNNGIELPISETGECRIQFSSPENCDSFC